MVDGNPLLLIRSKYETAVQFSSMIFNGKLDVDITWPITQLVPRKSEIQFAVVQRNRWWHIPAFALKVILMHEHRSDAFQLLFSAMNLASKQIHNVIRMKTVLVGRQTRKHARIHAQSNTQKWVRLTIMGCVHVSGVWRHPTLQWFDSALFQPVLFLMRNFTRILFYLSSVVPWPLRENSVDFYAILLDGW